MTSNEFFDIIVLYMNEISRTHAFEPFSPRALPPRSFEDRVSALIGRVYAKTFPCQELQAHDNKVLVDFEEVSACTNVEILSRCDFPELLAFSMSSKVMSALVASSIVWRAVASRIGCPINESSGLPVYKQVLRFIEDIQCKIKSYNQKLSKHSQFKLKSVPRFVELNHAQAWIKEIDMFFFQRNMSNIPWVNDLGKPPGTEGLFISKSYLAREKVKEFCKWEDEGVAFLKASGTLSVWGELASRLLALQTPNVEGVQDQAALIQKASEFTAWFNQHREALMAVTTQFKMPCWTLLSVPPEIGQLVNLVDLDLSWQFLRELPREIFRLGQLRWLRLARNRFIAISPQVSQLQALRLLDLSDNRLSFLPPEIGSLGNLKRLYLCKNRLKALPSELGALTNLRDFNISENQFQIVPSIIGQLIHLERLSLHCNSIASLPSQITCLASLKTLYLHDNQFTSFPPQLLELLQLEELGLSDNYLESIPPQIQLLLNLGTLDLSHNLIFSLPAEIGMLQKLRSLGLYHNQLGSLPSELGKIPELWNINCAENQLVELPYSLLSKQNSINVYDNPLSLRYRAVAFAHRQATVKNALVGAGLIATAWGLYSYPTTALNALVNVVDTVKEVGLYSGTAIASGVKFLANKLSF